MKLLFVCLGNICRSPLAEGIAKKFAKEHHLKLTIDSAGTSSWHQGEHPCQNSITIARKHHVEIADQHSRPVSKEDIDNFDYIIAMDKQNKKDLQTQGFKDVLLIGDFGGYQGQDVPDPYYFNGLEGFEKVYTMLEVAIEDFMSKNISGMH